MTNGKKKVISRVRTQTSSTKTFYVSVEGEKTEMQYFKNLNYFVRTELKRRDISIFPFRSEIGPAPQHVLSCMKEKFNDSTKHNSSDEAWLVIDRNSWNSSQLDELQDWSDEKDSHNFALSNPCFEYWLLLHFESGAGIKSKSKCENKISQHIGYKYDGSVDKVKFTLDTIRKAVDHAKMGGVFSAEDCRQKPGSSTVFQLIENVLKS